MADEWYTPPEDIEVIYKVMGSIDLDPTSNDIANRRVGADRYYTKDDSCLDKDWSTPQSEGSTVFMNPPYSKPAPWVDQLQEEHRLGHVKEAIILLNVSTSSQWWQQLRDYPICFCKKRIRFMRPDGTRGKSPRYANAFVYVGDRPARFARQFARLGTVVTRLGAGQ